MSTVTPDSGATAPASPIPQYVITGAENDWFLQSLVSMVNTSDLSIGITLFVGGVLVSGQLIGGRHYFEEFGQSFADALTGENDDAKTAVKNHFAVHSKIYLNEDGTYKEDTSAPHYIHLKDARTFHPGGTPIPEGTGVLWRGRVREVSGFTLGALSMIAS